MSIAYNTGATGSFGAPLPGMTVQFGTSSGGSDLGVARLRSWTPAGTSGVISVGENDDVTPYVSSGNHIRIGGQWRLWPIYPRAVISGNNAIIYTDYDIPFSDQTSSYKPVAVAGPPAVVEYNGTNAQASFVGDRSFALAPGATITGYLWTAPGSVQGSSTSQGTEGSPVTFTWTSTGQKLVYLRVTDSNGKTATNYTWTFVVDPNNPETVAYVNFDSYNDNFDFEQGGGSCTFMVEGGATIADFPNEAMVVMASRPTTPGQTTPTGYWPNRDNVHFVGYIVGNTVRQNPVSGDVTFTAVSIDTMMRNVTAFPVSLTYRNAPQDWTMAANLTTDRAASYLWHYHSTLSLMASIRPSNYAGLIQRQDFGPNGGIFAQLDSELMSSLWGKVVVNHQGVVHHLIDYNLMNNTERSAVTVRKTLHKGVWVDDLNIEERHTYSLPVNVVKMSGVLYPGGEIDDVCPLFSEAPGNAPKVFGSEMNYDRLILTSQTDLNIRCGRALAKQNAKYTGFGLRFINDGSFTIAPQELFTSSIEVADNDRGLALTTRLLPRRISRTFDNQVGLISYDVGFEPETDGPAGVTVDLPCGPPEQKMPTNRPPSTPSDTSGANSLASASEGSSFYFAQKTGQTWQRRVAGLTSLNLQDMIKDPWSDFKNGHNIDHIILWGCGSGFLTRSPDTGQNWEDHTPYLENPPNSWADAVTPNITGTAIKQVMGDLFREDHLFLLAQNSGTGTAYRGWLMRSTDAGFTFTSYALTGSSQAYPIRMDLDKQDGTVLWVTLWEGNNQINLRKYGITAAGLTLTSSHTLMTGTTVNDVTARTFDANPLAPLGNKNLIYVYGRLNNPQGLTGTVAIMNSSNGGSVWTSVINDWGADRCGSLFIGEEAGSNRQAYAVRQG